ncbi:MAG: hypothetical protein KF760_01900 [Candidatus Eremiobacteraeota bacterium]|nr:hypothetical protein [Candidatus Eremiobacteraeota bacterium]MCW5872161.1 hypothetical protein [Candidatus Eremiobacteraeota bacterium]
MAFGRSDPDALVAAFASSDFSHDDTAWNEAVEQDKAPGEFDVPEIDADGNYNSPVLTRVLDGYAAYLEDRSQRRAFTSTLDNVRTQVERLLNTMDACLQEGLDDPNNPIHQAARAGFEDFLTGLDELQDSVEQRDPKLADGAFEMLRLGTNRIMDAYAFFQKLRNVVMTLNCPQCEAENRKGDTKCHACGVTLPQFETVEEGRVLAENAEGVLRQEPSTPALTTPNYQKLELALHRWRQNEIDDSALWNEISQVETNMNGHRQVNQSEMEDTEGLTEQEQEITLRLLGLIDVALDGSLKALDEMKLYWEDRDMDHLDKGMAMMGPPTQQMIEAFLALQSITVEED